MSQPQSGPLLVFENVGKRFGDVIAVTDMNLEIGRGDFIAIMGPSGCGKTTTLRMLAGLEAPSEGKIYYNGNPIGNVPPWKREMPLVWQSYALFPFLSVLDNVAFGLKSRKVPKEERQKKSQEWLDRLGIGALAGRLPGTLSGGQAQRVALARALVLEPEVLILDEPLSALDAHMVVRMQSELAELQRNLGITFVYVTHNQSEALAMANQVVIMNNGRIEQVGEPLDIYRAPQTQFVAEFVGTNNLIPGKVESVDENCVRIDTKIGSMTTTNPTELTVREGQDVNLVISADMLHLTGIDESTAENHVEARLVGESFAGTVVTLFFKAENGQELKVQIQQRALRENTIQIGETKMLNFDSGETLIVAAT